MSEDFEVDGVRTEIVPVIYSYPGPGPPGSFFC